MVLRKELVVSNNSLRALVKKTNDIASVADQLAVAFIHNRRLLAKIDSQVATVAAAAAAPRDTPASASVHANVAPEVMAASTTNPLPSPRTQLQMEKEDAEWVLILKPVLEAWLQNKFVTATCAADVWVSMAEVNIYLRD